MTMQPGMEFFVCNVRRRERG